MLTLTLQVYMTPGMYKKLAPKFPNLSVQLTPKICFDLLVSKL